MDRGSRGDDAAKQRETSSVFPSLQVWARPRGQFYYGDRRHRTPQEDEDPDGRERDSPALVPGKGNALHIVYFFATCLCWSLSAFEKEENGCQWLAVINFLHFSIWVLMVFPCRNWVQKKKKRARAKLCCKALPQSLLLDLTLLPPTKELWLATQGTCSIFWSLGCISAPADPCQALTPWESGSPSVRQGQLAWAWAGWDISK